MNNRLEDKWSTNIRNICYAVGKLDSWEKNEAVNVKYVQQSLLTQYESAWRIEMLNKSKLSNYVQIKQSIKTSPYVKINLDKGKRSLMCQLMSGILPLQLELGRYTNTCREMRKCLLCKEETECELHFLFRCTKLHNVKLKLYYDYPELLQLPEVIRICLLLDKPNLFANFVNELWQERARMNIC